VVNNFMTEAGWVVVWAWCESRGAAVVWAAGGAKLVAELDLTGAGSGAITTLKAAGGTCAFCRVFKTDGGKLDAWGGAAHAVLAAPAITESPANRASLEIWGKVNGAKRRAQPVCRRNKIGGRWTQFKIIRQV
jgi:hypothetical protein